MARQAAEFTVESGQAKMAQLLQAQPKFDALWNHDDDQGVGALRAIEQAGRDDFLMVGGAGALSAFEAIKADNGVLKATVLYPPTMAASAIDLARALGQGKGVERPRPSSRSPLAHPLLGRGRQGATSTSTCRRASS